MILFETRDSISSKLIIKKTIKVFLPLQCHQMKAEIVKLHIAGQFSPNFPTIDIRLSCTLAAESRQLSSRAKIFAI